HSALDRLRVWHGIPVYVILRSWQSTCHRSPRAATRIAQERSRRKGQSAGGLQAQGLQAQGLQSASEISILAAILRHIPYGTGRSDRMLHTHGRYGYSNITRRPDYSWPGGRRLAVYVAVNIEQFRYGDGKGAAIAPPDQANSHSIFSWRDYGNRVGIWRLFDLFDALALPIEAQMNTAIYDSGFTNLSSMP